MNVLDDNNLINKLDKANVLNSIAFFPKQCLQALNETKNLNLLVSTKNIKNIVICGMGGSAFAAEIVKTLFNNEVKLPCEIIRDYDLPLYVNKDSLVIASSYSGNTEETLNTTHEALKRQSVIMGLTNGGKLADLILNKTITGYIFKEKFNPCHQPRVGLGYMISGILGLLIKSNLINLSFKSIKSKILKLENKYLFNIPSNINEAKKMAFNLKNKFVFLISSEFLNGIIHGFANQLNETAKVNSIYHYIPELNHHRLEGLKFPKVFSKFSIFLFYPSKFYNKNNIKRYKITKEVIEKNGYKTRFFKSEYNDKHLQALDIINFNSYVSFYLAILNNVDPSKIPWVDYFKTQLKKPLPNDS